MYSIKRVVASGDKRIIEAYDGEWKAVARPLTISQAAKWLHEDVYRERR
jgi:hypothetical protein